MPAHARTSGSDSLAAGRARQRLKIVAVGYAGARHGIDADEALVRGAAAALRRAAIEFAQLLPDAARRRVDLHHQVNDEVLRIAAIAYWGARHGIDADVGMAREGMAFLCQGAIDFYELLPLEDATSKRSTNPHLQLGNGV